MPRFIRALCRLLWRALARTQLFEDRLTAPWKTRLIAFLAAKAAPDLPPSLVGLVQSPLPTSDGLTDCDVRDLVREAVALAGGLAGVVRPGATVLIKPNLVLPHDGFGRSLPELANGVTTDRRVVAAVAELAREAGAGRIIVAEGSSAATRSTFEHFGYDRAHLPQADAFLVLEDESGDWRDHASPRLRKVRLPDGLYKRDYYFNRRYYEADIIISVPTLKVHPRTVITGAVKNVAIGATPANIYGRGPGDHMRWAIPHRRGRLHCFIADYYKCRPADFAVVDGLVGLARGPMPNPAWGSISQEADRQNMRCILASRDPIAADAVAALIMGWDPRSVRHLSYLGADGLGNADPAKIIVAGQRVATVRRYFAGSKRRHDWGGRVIPSGPPPGVGIRDCTLTGNTCVLSVVASAGTVRLELHAGGELIGCWPGRMAVMEVERDRLAQGSGEPRVVAYDRFLNHAEVAVDSHP